MPRACCSASPTCCTPSRCARCAAASTLPAHAWVDGRATAGHQGAQVKRNLQIAEDAPIARELGAIVLAALERHPLFLSAALPRLHLPADVQPLRGRRRDAFRHARRRRGAAACPAPAMKIRTDISATLFLSPPEDYDGGELQVEDTYGAHSVKLPAGDLVLYPATSLHRVTPVTRGARIASFFWVQSLVRDDAQRALLFDLDMAIVRLTPGRAGARVAGFTDRLLSQPAA